MRYRSTLKNTPIPPVDPNKPWPDKVTLLDDEWALIEVTSSTGVKRRYRIPRRWPAMDETAP